MNALAAILIWLLSSLGLPTDGLQDGSAPNCNTQTESSSGGESDCTSGNDLVLQRFPRIYNGF